MFPYYAIFKVELYQFKRELPHKILLDKTNTQCTVVEINTVEDIVNTVHRVRDVIRGLLDISNSESTFLKNTFNSTQFLTVLDHLGDNIWF